MVVVLVTSFADDRSILECRGLMALLARNSCVKPNQRKARDVVIERYFLPPSGFRVALRAIAAELPFMRSDAL